MSFFRHISFVLLFVVSLAEANTVTQHPAILSSEFIYEKGPYPECHASTIVETTDGHLVAAWFGGTKERNPDVCIYVARFENGKWTEGVEVANGVQTDGKRLTAGAFLQNRPQSA